MSIMFLEGAYPSPGEAHEGRLQLVEVSLHTQVKCSDNAGKEKTSCRQRDKGFELSILGVARAVSPIQRGEIPAAGMWRLGWVFRCLCFLPVMPGFSPARVTSGTQRLTTLCPERNS